MACRELIAIQNGVSPMLIDNKKDQYPGDGYNIVTVWDYIRSFIGRNIDNPDMEQKGRLDIVTGYFTIRALSKLYRELPEDDLFRIVSSEMVEDPNKADNVIDLLNGDGSINTIIELADYAKEAVAFLKRDTVEIKAVVNAFCHAKLYLFTNNILQNDSFYLSGSSNLTDAGLGLKATSNVELNVGNPCKTFDNDYKELNGWFNDLWKNIAKNKVHAILNNPKSELIDVKEFFIRKIEEYFRTYTPEEIYYKILFELFNADIELDNSLEHQKDMSTLQNSVIWKTLFNYQQKGVISLIKMLRNYNGAILADAVGLGKTFSALAVIKYFQTKGYLTILLCPKKLEYNWTQYLRRRGSRFEDDKFDYLVRFHTDLQDERLMRYDDARLDYLQHNKRILIVIDESHNLRNEKSERYQELMSSLIRNMEGHDDRDVKVLMLSATPINTGLNDVKGQFNLIGHGNDDAFNNDTFGVESLRNLFTDAQRKFTKWCEDDNRTIGGFISKLPPKFFNLTDKLIVARTRKLIEKTLGEDLGFPDKDKPVNVYQGVEHFGKYNTTEEIYAAFEELLLTAYQPSCYIPKTIKKARKEAHKEWDDDVNREMFLVKMMGILFMKRLESSWYSCMLTVEKVLDVHKRTLQMVEEFKQKKNDGLIKVDEDGVVSTDEDDIIEGYSLRKGTINIASMQNLNGFEKGLKADVKNLNEIYLALKDFETKYRQGNEHDLKFEHLVKILQDKQKSENKKVVIFTAYSDTAKFLFDELQTRGFTRLAYASGQSVGSTGHHSTRDFTEVLESFAPYSKLYKEKDWTNLYEDAKLNRSDYYDDEKHRWNVDYEKWQQLVYEYDRRTADKIDDGIDILIATDCLSEGQNLQDANMQINYDIHWNPVRLIQRFGRIDRIGSPNKLIRCVNFWPAKSFEAYLNLENRIQNRMSLMKLVDTETLDVTDSYKKMVEDNPLQDKNADRLLKELTDNSISDIESAETLSLKDFSFETYRQDLVDYLDRNRDEFRRMPNGIFSGFKLPDNLFEQIPESLVAVVGYPHREEGSCKPYKEIYLMCQPTDPKKAAMAQEMNRAEVLELLRTNKKAERFVPSWIEGKERDCGNLCYSEMDNRNERLERLSEILRSWMDMKAPRQAIVDRKERFRSKNAEKKDTKEERLDVKFKCENFDLITWEYISK